MGFDGIIFDCDGVLVDVSESYDRTIDTTCREMCKILRVPSVPITRSIIESFKKLGRFNDEVDLTYACIISLYTASRTGYDPQKFFGEVTSNVDGGIDSIIRYAQERCDLSGPLKVLGSLEERRENPVYDMFNRLFYGQDLYQKLFGRTAASGPGLIRNDRLLVDAPLLDTLRERFGKMGMVTGRGLASARLSLGSLLDRFDTRCSAFLEDEPRSMAKPNPRALDRAISNMGIERCLYVGDSIEDMMMADSSRFDVEFCGITGTSHDPASKRELFRDAYMVVWSVRDILVQDHLI